MPDIVAHRGFKARHPENTLAAFKAAIASGAHAIECDIQFSRDLVPVIIHDDDLSRTTNKSGSIFELDHQDLITTAANKEHAGTCITDINIPLLSELLSLVPHYPGIKFYIEIKEESLDHFGIDIVMNKLEAMLQPYKTQCFIISYDVPALQHARQHSSLGIGWVIHHYDDAHKQTALSLNPDYLICNHKKLPPGQPPWQGPWQWMLYEINDVLTAETWLKAGIDNIETADVSALRQSSQFSPSPLMSQSE